MGSCLNMVNSVVERLQDSCRLHRGLKNHTMTDSAISDRSSNDADATKFQSTYDSVEYWG